MKTNNQHLESIADFIDACTETGIISTAAFQIVRKMLVDVPKLGAYCNACGWQPEENQNAPVALKMRSCGHYSCDRCVSMCSDDHCAKDACDDCRNICEGHAMHHCAEHVVGKSYCEECAPPVTSYVGREMRAPASCYDPH
jgi:hypothetical protein